MHAGATAFLLSAVATAGPIPVTSCTPQADGVLFTMQTGKMKLKACTDNIVRVTYTPAASFSKRPSLMIADTFATPPSWDVDSTAATVTLQTARMKVEVTRATGALRFLNASGDVLIAQNPDTGINCSVASVDNSGYTAGLAFTITSAEGVYGGGHYDKDNTLNRNTAGHTFRTIPANRDKPIPFLISTNQWGILWDNYSDTYWRFSGSTPRTLSISSEVGDGIDYYMIYGEELDSIVAGYRAVTGIAPLFPKQAYGFWQSKCQFNNQSELLNDVTQFRNRKIPVDVIVQDWLWWNDNVASASNGGGERNGYWNSMTWDVERYASPATMVSTVHQNHMLLAISVWPTLGINTTAYKDFSERGWTWPSFYVFGNAYTYDPYRPEAGALLWDYMNTGVNGTGGIFNKGIDIWWFDGSEPEIGDGMGETQKNLKTAITSQAGSNYLGSYHRYVAGYSLVHSRNVYTNQRAANSSKRVCVLTRSVYAGQQRYASITWIGDAQSEWTQFQREMAMGMNFCAAGVPYWSTDPGAFYAYNWNTTTPSNAEFRALYTRWFQFSAFLPIFRSHGTAVTEREMWNFQQYNDNTYESQLLFDRLRYRLLPYLYSLAWKVTSAGYTIMRTLPFDFRSDPGCYSVASQYMFGSAIMVSPVTSYNATSRSVYLPSGTTWYDFWTGAASSGGKTITVEAPITSMPLHVPAGSIIPMGPMIEYTTQKQADTIELRIYPGANGRFTLYEDEGDSYNYEKGTYATIPITYTDNPQQVVIGARSGSFPGMLQNRIFNVVYVSDKHGLGLAATTNPDCVIPYSGTAMAGCPVTSVGTAPASCRADHQKKHATTIRTVMERIVFPNEFAGSKKSIAVYDLKGSLLYKIVTGKNDVLLRTDFRAPNKLHIIKITAIE